MAPRRGTRRLLRSARGRAIILSDVTVHDGDLAHERFSTWGKLKIGVMVESFRLGIREGIAKAAKVGAHGFQVYTTGGEMHPDNLTKTGGPR